MDDAGEGSRATRRQVLQAAGGALAVGTLSRRGAAQASGPTVYVGSSDEGDGENSSGTLYAVDAATGEEEWAFTCPSDWVSSSPTVVADTESGDSVGSRVRLGTLGHHGNVDDADQRTDPAPDDFGPGFGVGAGLTALGGVGYALKRRATDDDTDQQS